MTIRCRLLWTMVRAHSRPLWPSPARWDNSVIVIVGDHGEAFMQHGFARHGVHLWEEMIHVPLIIWAGPEVRKDILTPCPHA